MTLKTVLICSIFVIFPTEIFSLRKVIELTLPEKVQSYNIDKNSHCRYDPNCLFSVISPPNTKIGFQCGLIIRNGYCDYNNIQVSLNNGNTMDVFCDDTNISTTTQGNSLKIAVNTATYGITNFQCSLRTIPKEVCNCGIKGPPSGLLQVVNSMTVQKNEFPSMAALVYTSSPVPDVFCGATIISNRFAITAAHCVFNKINTFVGLLVGAHNLVHYNTSERSALYSIQKFIVHENFYINTLQNDIALVKTNKLMAFNSAINPACLPFGYSSRTFNRKSVTIVGSGVTGDFSIKSDYFQKADVTVMSYEQCLRGKTDYDITQNHICTETNRRDACFGDSGGPIFWMDPTKQRLQLVGVISFGTGCANSGPAVHTRITSYLTWILNNTGEQFCIP